MSEAFQLQISKLCDRAKAETELIDVFKHAETLKAASVRNDVVGTVQSIAVEESEMLASGLEGEIFNLDARLDVEYYLECIGGNQADSDLTHRARRYICRSNGEYGFYILSLPFAEANKVSYGGLEVAIAFYEMTVEAGKSPCFYGDGERLDRTVHLVSSVLSDGCWGKEKMLNAGYVLPFGPRTELCIICSDYFGWGKRELCRYAASKE